METHILFPEVTLIIHGKEFPDVSSLDWLEEAVAEKLARERTPNSETGLMDCGCGGKPVRSAVLDNFYSVWCNHCNTGTVEYRTQERADIVWNAAHGWGKDPYDSLEGKGVKPNEEPRNCGCGDTPDLLHAPTGQAVQCPTCGMRTFFNQDKETIINTWNQGVSGNG